MPPEAGMAKAIGAGQISVNRLGTCSAMDADNQAIFRNWTAKAPAMPATRMTAS
jgi:hypothetical protein